MKVGKVKALQMKLNKNELTVLEALDYAPKRLIDIELESGLPHSSVFDTLQSLEGRGLIKNVLVNKRKLWKLSSENKIRNRSNLKSLEGGTANIEIYNGKEAILSNIYNLFENNKNKRVLVYHGPKVFSEWYKILNEQEIVNFNLLLQKMNIIVERFVPEKEFATYIKKVSKEYKESLINRSQITYLLPDNLFDSKTELILFSDQVVIYESQIPRLIILKEKETIKMHQNIFEIFRKLGNKIDSQKEFTKYL
jgi:sugar-specific transcriptional regulator TrmB